MKYFLIVGEASGDLHAANLMRAIRERDPQATFVFVGGDMMSNVGGIRIRHYKALAYMGLIPVVTHLRTILKGMRQCKKSILKCQPDVVILVDYPGFNLNIAKFVSKNSNIPVFYYILPKVWAWKERRVKSLRKYTTELFSILPFEKDFFEGKHNIPIHYEGNPTVDEVYTFKTNYQETFKDFAHNNNINNKQPIIAILAGSRKQEIRDNLLTMCLAANTYLDRDYQLVIAGAPAIDEDFYEEILSRLPDRERFTIRIVYENTYPLLFHAKAALVTSGTAALETALFGVPQIVCYYIPCGKLIAILRKLFLKIKYISLVNLVCNSEVVPELVANEMNTINLREHLKEILPGGSKRKEMMQMYQTMQEKLGLPGSSERTANDMLEKLNTLRNSTNNN